MAKDPQDTIPEYPTSIPPSILLLILDLHPLSWSLLSQPPPQTEEGDKIKNASIDLGGFLNVLMVFLNAVMASSGGNQVVVYGATSGKSYVSKRASDSCREPTRFTSGSCCEPAARASWATEIRTNE
jgi:transcription initiation factor TFIIH subunit 3